MKHDDQEVEDLLRQMGRFVVPLLTHEREASRQERMASSANRLLRSLGAKVFEVCVFRAPARRNSFTTPASAPKHISQMHSELPPSGVRDPSNSRRVLVVDDDPDSCEVLCMVLEAGGHEPRAATSAAEAVALAPEFKPHVALIDLDLHVTDGCELVRLLALIPELEGCRFVATTGYSEPEAVARSTAAGFEIHLTKPMSVADVLTAVAGRGAPEQAAR